MSMKEWAKKEIEIACARERGDKDSDEWDYGCACYESAYRAFESLLEDGHSGMSMSITKNILNRLIDGKSLTPIEDTPDVWEEVFSDEEKRTFQCKRMSSLFKEVYLDEIVKYFDTQRVVCVRTEDLNNSYSHWNFVDKFIDERYPIHMPYMPADRPYCVYIQEFEEPGLYRITSMETPSGDSIFINKLFRETDEGFKEIVFKFK